MTPDDDKHERDAEFPAAQRAPGDESPAVDDDDAFASERYEGMSGDPIGPTKGPGRND